jgi:hypothetical protein
MRDALPIWDVWTKHLPQILRAADVCVEGARLLPRDDALRCAHLEFNTRGCLSWLVFDLDAADSFECWGRAGLPPPNFYAQNRNNGHGHLGYCLRRPVGLLGHSRRRPIELAADVQRGMTRRLGADPAYNNRLAKNPVHARWASTWYAPHPYALLDLLEVLDKRDMVRPASGREVQGVSRNCDLFDALRQHAYQQVRTFKRGGGAAWFEHLLRLAVAINQDFMFPLSVSEVRQIARSVANWTWRTFSSARFSQIQARRGSIGGQKSGQRRSREAERTADAVLAIVSGSNSL